MLLSLLLLLLLLFLLFLSRLWLRIRTQFPERRLCLFTFIWECKFMLNYGNFSICHIIQFEMQICSKILEQNNTSSENKKLSTSNVKMEFVSLILCSIWLCCKLVQHLFRLKMDGSTTEFIHVKSCLQDNNYFRCQSIANYSFPLEQCFPTFFGLAVPLVTNAEIGRHSRHLNKLTIE